MKKRSTRFLSLLLSLLMLISVFPAGTMTAQAANSQVEQILAYARYVAANKPHAYDGYCQLFVSDCYTSAGYRKVPMGSALNAGDHWISSTSANNIPTGALVFFDHGTQNMDMLEFTPGMEKCMMLKVVMVA